MQPKKITFRTQKTVVNADVSPFSFCVHFQVPSWFSGESIQSTSLILFHPHILFKVKTTDVQKKTRHHQMTDLIRRSCRHPQLLTTQKQLETSRQGIIWSLGGGFLPHAKYAHSSKFGFFKKHRLIFGGGGENSKNIWNVSPPRSPFHVLRDTDHDSCRS